MRRLAFVALLASALLWTGRAEAQHAKRDSTLAATLKVQSDTIFRDKSRPAYVERARLRVLAVSDSLKHSKPDTARLTHVDTVIVVRVDTVYVTTPVGIAVLPGQSIQAAVDANPAGTTFILKAGTHVRQQVIPKANDSFVGEGAHASIMDGQGATAFAFYGWNGSAWVNAVTLRNLDIRKYAPPAQRGAVTLSGDDTLSSSTGWVIDSLVVRYTVGIGIRIGHRAQVRRTDVDSNSTLGIGGIGRAVLIDSVRSRFNNPGCVNNPGFESGGSKFVYTDSLVVRRSVFSDNCGAGLWEDIWNRNSLLENNVVERNYREGIVIEVGGPNHVIRNNSVNDNGVPVDPFRANGWGWDAGIGIHETPGVEVYGNTLSGNFNGIVVLQQQRDVAHGDAYAPPGGFLAQDAYIHDNTITQRNAAGCDGAFAGGAVQDWISTPNVHSRNNRWVHNTYYLGTNPCPFAWANGGRTAAEWRAYGQDTTGTFNP